MISNNFVENNNTTQAQHVGVAKVLPNCDVSASTQSMTEEEDSDSTEEGFLYTPPQYPCFVNIQTPNASYTSSSSGNASCLERSDIHQSNDSAYPPGDLDESDDDSSFAPLEDDDESLEADRNFSPHSPEKDPSSNESLSQEPPMDPNHFNESNFVQPKSLPGLSNSHKMVCVSFLERNVSTAVVCQVLDEALRMLRPGGLLYVIDKGGATVRKHPTMRQWLTRVRDPTVKHFVHEIETRAILQANGWGHATLDENNKNGADNWSNDDIVRWVGMKS